MKTKLWLYTLCVVCTLIPREAVGQNTISRNKTKVAHVHPAKKQTKQKIREIAPRLSQDDLLFPLYGIELGKTTLKDAVLLGLSIDKESIFNNILIDRELFLASSVIDGKETYGYYSNNCHGKMNPKWSALGFDWANSYNEWINVLKTLGYIIEVLSDPTVTEFHGKECLKAKIKAIPQNGNINLELNFNYGEKGSSLDSPSSLYEITASVISK